MLKRPLLIPASSFFALCSTLFLCGLESNTAWHYFHWGKSVLILWQRFVALDVIVATSHWVSRSWILAFNHWSVFLVDLNQRVPGSDSSVVSMWQTIGVVTGTVVTAHLAWLASCNGWPLAETVPGANGSIVSVWQAIGVVTGTVVARHLTWLASSHGWPCVELAKSSGRTSGHKQGCNNCFHNKNMIIFQK